MNNFLKEASVLLIAAVMVISVLPAVMADTTWVGYTDGHTEAACKWSDGSPWTMAIELSDPELAPYRGQALCEVRFSCGCDDYGFFAEDYEIYYATGSLPDLSTLTPIATGTASATGWTTVDVPAQPIPAAGSAFVIVSYVTSVGVPAGMDDGSSDIRGGHYLNYGSTTDWLHLQDLWGPYVWGLEAGIDTAPAILIWDNGDPDDVNGFPCYRIGQGGDGGVDLADDFHLTGQCTIERVEWHTVDDLIYDWQGYADVGVFQYTPSGPGDLIDFYHEVDCTREHLGEKFNRPWYRYEVDLLSQGLWINLFAGDYYILLRPYTSGDVGMSWWLTSPGHPGSTSEGYFRSDYFGYPDWTPISTSLGSFPYDFSFKIYGTCGEIQIPVYVDIKPGSCPNPINTRSKGVISVAICGTDTLDVTTIDPNTVTLEGVPPVRLAYGDVATPFDGELCDCHELTGDGYLDMVFKFKTQELVEALGDVNDREVLTLTMSGCLLDGTPFEGYDCVWIIDK